MMLTFGSLTKPLALAAGLPGSYSTRNGCLSVPMLATRTRLAPAASSSSLSNVIVLRAFSHWHSPVFRNDAQSRGLNFEPGACDLDCGSKRVQHALSFDAHHK